MATAFPQPYPPDELKKALAKLAESKPLTPVERALAQHTLDESPAAPDDWADVTLDEIAKLEAEAVEAEEGLRAGRCIPVEKVFAARGMRYPPTRTE